MQNEYFNLALVPESKEFQRLCIDLARANLSEQSDHYLLGDNALPHVTVCQFEVPQSRLSSVWSAFESFQTEPLLLFFRHIYFQYGKNEYWGKCWLGLAVKYEAEIIELQKRAYATLLDLDIASKNTPESYFPHLTFARCDVAKQPKISVVPPEEIWLNRYSFRLTIAESDEHGRYHKQLCP